jgi:hypothetical protein
MTRNAREKIIHSRKKGAFRHNTRVYPFPKRDILVEIEKI